MSKDILRRLNTASVIIGNLPEQPGYNGSILLIDDIEADEIEKSIDAGVSEIEKLRALLDLIFASTLPYNDGEPTFSDEVTNAYNEMASARSE